MRSRVYLLFVIAAALASCGGGSPQTPSPTPAPAPKPTVVLASLKVSGPSTIAPGASAQFTATGQMSDGSSQDYTTKVSWNGGPSAVLSIAASGMATGQSPGDAQVQAIMPGFIARTDVIVVPAGTFRLGGVVSEFGLPVWDARVSVIAGQGTGLSSLTWSDGTYQLFGVAGLVQVQVTKAGYVPLIKSFTVTSNDVLDFPEFAQPGTAPSIVGSYIFSFQASDDCQAPFMIGSTILAPIPVEDRSRTYSATLTQTGPRVHVALGGADFYIHDGFGDYFEGRFSPEGLMFALGNPYYYTLEGPDVVERLSSGRVLVMDGWARAPMAAKGVFHAAFHGTLTELPLLPSNKLGDAGGLCHSENHQFTLTPVSSVAGRRR